MSSRICIFALAHALVFANVFAQREVIPFEPPENLEFEPSRFALPDAADYRVEMPAGLVAFIIEDLDVSTVELTALVGMSRLDDPDDKTGLAQAVAYGVRRGPATWESSRLDEFLYRTSAELSVTVDNEHTRVSLTFLKDDIEEALELFASLLRRPRLDQAALDAFRQSATRPPWNPDDPRRRPEFEFARLLYAGHRAGRVPSAGSLGALTVQDLKEFHARFFSPNNTVIAASGGLERAKAVETLRGHLFDETWENREIKHSEFTAVPAPKGRVIHAWDVDRRQGWAVAGHLGVQGRASDRHALEIANYVLGGGGAVWKRIHAELAPARAEGHFDARLFNESRAKRGLTNDTSSYVPVGFRVATPIYAVTLGRPESMAYLIKIIDEEWKNIGSDITDLEIEIAKGALTEGYFQMRYAGAHATALSFAEELFFDGGHTWAENYEEKIRTAAKKDVLAAAKKYYRPEDLFVALVGPIDAMLTEEHPLYKAKLSDFGEIVRHEW